MKNKFLVTATIMVTLCALSFPSSAQLQQPPTAPKPQIDTSPRVLPQWSTTPPAPKVTRFAINNGAPETKDRKVTLNNWYLIAGGASSFRASERSDFSDADAFWRSYSNAPQRWLSAGSGQKTVYFQIKNASGLVSNIVSDTIYLTEYTFFNLLPGDVYEYAKGRGYTFTANANDPNSECEIKRLTDGSLMLRTHGKLSTFGAKCEYTLFNKSLHQGLHEEWTFDGDVIDDNRCFPNTDNSNHTYIQTPSEGSSSITYKIRAWCGATFPSGVGCSCVIYLKSLVIDGPKTGRWQDAFQ